MDNISPSFKASKDYRFSEDDKTKLIHAIEVLPLALTDSAVQEAEKTGDRHLPDFLNLSAVLGDTDDHIAEFIHSYKATVQSALINEDRELIPQTYNALWSILDGRKPQFAAAAKQTGLHLTEGFTNKVYDAIATRVLAIAAQGEEMQIAMNRMSESAEAAVSAHLRGGGLRIRGRDVPDSRDSLDPRDRKPKLKPALNDVWRTQRITPQISTWIGSLAPLLETHIKDTWERKSLDEHAPKPEQAIAAAKHLYVTQMKKIAECGPNLRTFENQMEAFETGFSDILTDTELCDNASAKMLKMLCTEWRKEIVMLNLSERLEKAWSGSQKSGGTRGGGS